MKLIHILPLLLLSATADLIGYNRQKAVAEHSKLIAQNAETTQDQIIIHLVKSGNYKQLRMFVAKIKSVNREENFQKLFRIT